MSQYLYAFHDEGGEHLHADKPGWTVITEAIGCDPNDLSGKDYRHIANRGITVIVRLNNAYEPEGTIPRSEHYGDFAKRCANFVRASQGCALWIIGNEPNHIVERPQGEVITPTMMADCFNQCYAAIKAAVPTAEVITPPIAPWDASTKYHGNERGDWVIYFSDMHTAILACDGIGLHTYTHGAGLHLITSEARLSAEGYQHRRYEFRAYQDFLAAVPADKRHLPVYITEADQVEAWINANTGWVLAAYAEIDRHNGTPGAQQILCLALFRWQVDHDEWGIANKPAVHADFRAAVGRGFLSPTPALSTPSLPPVANTSTEQTLTLPLRDIDPRAEARGIRIHTPTVPPGKQFWRATRIYAPDPAESRALGPDRHILANALIDGRRQVDLPLLVTWGRGMPGEKADIRTKHNPGFAFGADHPLTPGEFTIEVADGKPSEKVVGIRMGAQTEQGWNPGIHTSTLVDFELVTMPETGQPTLSPTPQPPTSQIPALVHPVDEARYRVVTQPYGVNGDYYQQFMIDDVPLLGHEGIDFGTPTGTRIVAVAAGRVTEVGDQSPKGYGKWVKVVHSWGESIYAHLSQQNVRVGENVQPGQLLGLSGSTGNSSGPHLHFGLRTNPYNRRDGWGGYRDPAPFLNVTAAPGPVAPATSYAELLTITKVAAVEFKVDWRLLASLILAESSYNPQSLNPESGARGLGNLMAKTWAEWAAKLGTSDIFDPTDNARVTAAYLAWCIKTAGNERQGLWAYNWGIGRVLDAKTPPAETQAYATKVLFGRDLLQIVGA